MNPFFSIPYSVVFAFGWKFGELFSLHLPLNKNVLIKVEGLFAQETLFAAVKKPAFDFKPPGEGYNNASADDEGGKNVIGGK